MNSEQTSKHPEKMNFHYYENLRVEYTALSSFFNTVVTFRFTTLSLYLAAVGFIISGDLTPEKSILLIGISIAMWLIELRNQSLYRELANRGAQIEREYWGYKGQRAYESFYSRLIRSRPSSTEDSQAPDPPPLADTVIWKVKFRVSHTRAFNLLYTIVIIFSIYNLFF